MRGKFVRTPFGLKISEGGIQAKSLDILRKMGFQWPTSYVCTFGGYEEYAAGNVKVIEDVEKELGKVIDEQKSYSVSPSTSDSSEFPFSKYSTNAKGLRQVVHAIESIWELARKRELKTAVIIQEKLQTEYSGVVFTRNPMNGTDEVIVESVKGMLGDISVSDQIGVLRWIYKWGVWRDKPLDHESVFRAVNQLIKYARRIEKKCGAPVRVDWAYDGTSVYLLGFEPFPSIKGVNVYSNKMARERMPGIIRPLVWDINMLLFNSSWKRILVEVTGKYAESIELTRMSKLFYYRAYFNMGVFGDIFELLGMPRESMELILGVETGIERPNIRPTIKTIRFLPRIVFFALDKFMFSRKLMKFLNTQFVTLAIFRHRNLEELDKRKILNCIEELLEVNREASYFTIVTQMLAGFYNIALERYLERVGVKNGRIDFEKNMERLRDIDPDHHLSILQREFEAMSRTRKLQIPESNLQDSLKAVEDVVFKRLLSDFLERFGHFSDSNADFSKPQLREMPNLLLKMIEDSNRKTGQKQSNKARIESLVRNPGKKVILRLLWTYVTRYTEYVKRTSYIQSYGYGLFRDYFLRLGRQVKKEGQLGDEQDIFYLTFDEIKQACKMDKIPTEYKNHLERRKNEISAYEDVVLPELIYGDTPPILLTKKDAYMTLKGIAASRGYYEGRIKIVRGFEGFGKVQNGDILAIPYSHASWTPLFAKVKALISESGGICSHCSILAREREMPAVVSVKGVLDLEDGTRVVVDGYKGEVVIVT